MNRLKGPALIVLMLVGCFIGLAVVRAQNENDTFRAWQVSTQMRLTPASIPMGRRSTPATEAFRNEIVSLQFAVRSAQALDSFKATCKTSPAAGGNELPCSWVQIRYPGYVPVFERGEPMADPLLPSAPAEIKANWTQGVWLTISVPRDATPGEYKGALEVQAGAQSKTLALSLRVLNFTLPGLNNGKFYLNIWQDPAAVARAARVPLWSPEHWKLLEAYAKDLAAHGQRAISTSIINDPWRWQTGSPYPSMVKWSFPGKYQAGQASKFHFDFSVFDRYVELMMKAGINKSIQCFSMVDGPGSTSLCNIAYTDTSTGKLRVCPTRVGDASYRDVWGAFLPALVRHLKQHGWLNRTYIGFDEKPQTIMNGIFSVLKADAPELKVSLAGGSSSRESGSVGDLVLYYGELSHPATVRRLLEQRRGVGPTTFYTACGVPSPNTYLYSPQWESRLLPWIAFQYGLSGYTRWAYQSWPHNVWRRPVIRWHSGESFLVYPGQDGPIDSTRWELLRQGIEDHEALEMLEQKITALRKIPGRADEAANLQRRMMRDVRLATYVATCRGVPDPALSRRDINGLLRHVEGRPILGYVNDNRIISTFSPKDFMPDGNLQKAVWKNAKWVHVEHDMNGKKLEPQSAMDIATVWTPHYIYFAYHCKYTTLNIFKDADPHVEKFGLWDRDVVEAFINPQPERINHYYEFEISPNNLWVDLEINWAQPPATDADWDSHLDHATHIDPQNHTWNAEFRIPVASMGVKELYAGAEWRLNMFRCDGPGMGRERHYLAWAVVPHGRSFHQPTAFGIVQFVK